MVGAWRAAAVLARGRTLGVLSSLSLASTTQRKVRSFQMCYCVSLLMFTKCPMFVSNKQLWQQRGRNYSNPTELYVHLGVWGDEAAELLIPLMTSNWSRHTDPQKKTNIFYDGCSRLVLNSPRCPQPLKATGWSEQTTRTTIQLALAPLGLFRRFAAPQAGAWFSESSDALEKKDWFIHDWRSRWNDGMSACVCVLSICVVQILAPCQ